MLTDGITFIFLPDKNRKSPSLKEHSSVVKPQKAQKTSENTEKDNLVIFNSFKSSNLEGQMGVGSREELKIL